MINVLVRGSVNTSPRADKVVLVINCTRSSARA